MKGHKTLNKSRKTTKPHRHPPKNENTPRGQGKESATDTAKTPNAKTVALLVVASAVALLASAELVLSEITHLQNPSGALGCDLNPLVGCSSSLMSWQAHLLFGLPNSLVGAVLYAGLTGVFLAWWGGRLPRWLPLLVEAGLSAAIVLIIFLLQQSVTFFRTLCPFCLTIWVATILIWVHLGALLMRQGELEWLPAGFRKFWIQQRWLLTVVLLLLIVLVITLMLPDKLMRLL